METKTLFPRPVDGELCKGYLPQHIHPSAVESGG